MVSRFKDLFDTGGVFMNSAIKSLERKLNNHGGAFIATLQSMDFR